MKRIILAIAVLLGACSKPAPAPEAGDGAAPAAAVPATTSPAVATTSQWLKIAHTDAQGGGIYVDPSLTQVDPATGMTDVTLKVEHGDLAALDVQDAGTNLYQIEKVTFRFNCANKTFAIVKREALNKTGDVIDTTETKLDAASFKPVAPNGVGSVAVGQACPGK